MPFVVSPYRICPLGAHSDHQGGTTLGMAVSIHSTLSFESSASPEVRLESANYPGDISFDLGASVETSGWGRYAEAAARALGERISCGIRGRIEGALPGGGLSSSASVLVAYVIALADVNDVELSPGDIVELALRAEREFVGVKVGVLDPATIVGAKKGHLLEIDSRPIEWKPLPLGREAPPFRILVAFTGITRNLVTTGYNERVLECLEAARKLAGFAGIDEVTGLNDLPDAVFETFRDRLPAPEARRAEHFFTERSRVRRGAALWQAGDLEGFGELMNQSCESSITNWESGSPELIELQERVVATDGVFGSRFSGAGFGGCVIALVDDAKAEDARRSVEGALRSHPEARAFLVDSDDGVRLS